MTVAWRDRTSLLMWYGMVGGPAAFTFEHVAGYALTTAECSAVTRHSTIHMDAWVVVVTALAATVTAGAMVAAVLAWRRTRDAGEEPPGSRVHFMSVIGMAITPLFFMIILASGLGAIFLPNCVQS